MFDDSKNDDSKNDNQHESSHDHRDIAQRLDLLHFQDEAPGMVFWHPRGFLLYRLLEEAVRQHTRQQGYQEVRTPQILRQAIWEASGHWAYFRDAMFRVEDQACPAAVKPVSCPGHIEVVRRRAPSYRDLPLRLSEMGLVHRDEPAGTLHGLMRLRQFTQDDGHVFCGGDDAAAEVRRYCQAVPRFYRSFGFDDVRVALSTRPAERAGDDAWWDRAEAALLGALQELGIPYTLQPGAGAFYGPKLEYVLRDRMGRDWQCGTIQFDVAMPARFQLAYVDASGARRQPVMLHRAVYGSLERFLGILLEHHGATLPAWLAPVQVRVLPVGDDQAEAARGLHRRLADAGLRAELDAGASLGRRIAGAHNDGAPFVAVLGAREVAGGTVTLRAAGQQEIWAQPAAVAELRNRCQPPDFAA